MFENPNMSLNGDYLFSFGILDDVRVGRKLGLNHPAALAQTVMVIHSLPTF